MTKSVKNSSSAPWSAKDILSAKNTPRKSDGRRPFVVNRLFRRRDLINIVTEPRCNLLIELAVAVAAGGTWRGERATQGRVLLINPDWFPEDLGSRIDTIVSTMGLDGVFADQLEVLALRGPGPSWKFNDLENHLREIPFEKYDLIIVDGLYRFLPPRFSEHRDEDLTQVCLSFDCLAVKTGAAIALGGPRYMRAADQNFKGGRRR